MALDFPTNPTNGQVFQDYFWDAATGAWRGIGSPNNLGVQVGALNARNAYLNNRNYIINGDMEINQRGVTSVALTSGGHWTSDRFFGQSFGTIGVNQIRSTEVPANNIFTTSTLFDCTSAASGTGYAVNYTHRLEGYNAEKLGLTSGQSATMSFWVRSTRTGTYGITLSSGFRGTTYNFSYYVATYTINQANTWEYKTVTIPGNTSTYTDWYKDSRNGLEITFNITGGTGIATATTTNAWVELSTNAYFYGATSTQKDWGTSTADEFYITGVQFENGPYATPFKLSSGTFQGELSACQRYYQRITGHSDRFNNAGLTISGIGVSASAVFMSVQFQTQMRVAPLEFTYGGTLQLTDGTNYPGSGGLFTMTTASRNIAQLNIATSGAVQYRPYVLYGNSDFNAFLAFGAEL